VRLLLPLTRASGAGAGSHASMRAARGHRANG